MYIDIFTKFSSRRRVDASRHTARETSGRCDRDREAETDTHTHMERGGESERAQRARATSDTTCISNHLDRSRSGAYATLASDLSMQIKYSLHGVTVLN